MAIWTAPMTIFNAPFDKPYDATSIFSMEDMRDLIHIINTIRDNAVRYE